MTTYILCGSAVVAVVCVTGVVLCLGYMLCTYIASSAKGRSSKKWTDQ